MVRAVWPSLEAAEAGGKAIWCRGSAIRTLLSWLKRPLAVTGASGIN